MNNAAIAAQIKMLKKFLNQPNTVILDTETTGLPFHDESVSIVNISVINNRGEVLADYLVKPPCSIPPEVSAIHGITDETVQDAPSFEEISDVLHEILKDKIIGAWNAGFDRLMVEREMKRAGRSGEYCWVDLMKPYALANYKGMRYKLEKAARDEGITETQTHLSLGDCQMTLAVLQRFTERKTATWYRSEQGTRHAPRERAPEAFPDLELKARKAGF